MEKWEEIEPGLASTLQEVASKSVHSIPSYDRKKKIEGLVNAMVEKFLENFIAQGATPKNGRGGFVRGSRGIIWVSRAIAAAIGTSDHVI